MKGHTVYIRRAEKSSFLLLIGERGSNVKAGLYSCACSVLHHVHVGRVNVHVQTVHVRVPSTVRRAPAESSSISDLTVHVYVPSSPSFTLEMLREFASFLTLGTNTGGRSYSPPRKPLPVASRGGGQ